MGETKGRRRYDREFKEGAVLLILDGGRTVRGVAWDLGIHENMLHKWKQEYLQDKEHSFPRKDHMKPHEEEIFKLKRQIVDLEEDRAILKKALAIFEYIEIFYNRQRRHSALNQKSPLEYYQDATQTF